MVINATPGHPSANSYATIAEADLYHEGVIDSAVWDSATVDEKTRGLVSATRILDANVRWLGEAVSSSQSLQWPRYFVNDGRGLFLSSTVIPAAVVAATSELARRLLTAGTSAGNDDTANLKKMKAGPVELEFKDTATASGPIDDDVLQMVAFLTGQTSGASVRSVPVYRS